MGDPRGGGRFEWRWRPRESLDHQPSAMTHDHSGERPADGLPLFLRTLLMKNDPESGHCEKVTAYRPGPHWFALLGTAFTWPLLFVGGLVTTYRVGMAVPDWPTT